MKIALLVLLVTVFHCVFSYNLTAYYKPLTQEQATRLSSWTLESKVPMWVLSGQFEGDMVLSPDERNGVINTNLRWPGRVIPYAISNDFSNPQKQFIHDVLSKEYAKTCIKVVPRTNQRDFVYITGREPGCWSRVGRIGNLQQLNLQPNGCLWYGTVVHEFLHAAGFYHQQSATDRDNWVWILWDNIIEKEKHNFNKYPATMVHDFGERYDYGSVMHYPAKAFSKNGQDTIVTKAAGCEIGQNNGLSSTDIIKLNKMYGCS